jgi:hypothetical protein
MSMNSIDEDELPLMEGKLHSRLMLADLGIEIDKIKQKFMSILT